MRLIHTLAALAVVFGAAGAQAAELVAYKATADGIAQSLTGKPGDPVNGKKVAASRRLGNCLACHKMPMPEEDFQGDIGPELNGVGSRLTEPMLRLQIVNSKAVNPETVMPAFYRVEGLFGVRKDHLDKSILTADQVEDVVAYLMTLKD